MHPSEIPDCPEPLSTAIDLHHQKHKGLACMKFLYRHKESQLDAYIDSFICCECGDIIRILSIKLPIKLYFQENDND